MTLPTPPLIDWEEFRRSRARMGAAFVRRLGYFRDDGAALVLAIENAMRASDAAGLIEPAARLQNEADELGAARLAGLCEDIELFARHCIECHQRPDEYLPVVASLRGIFTETLDACDSETNPLMQRRDRAPLALTAIPGRARC